MLFVLGDWWEGRRLGGTDVASKSRDLAERWLFYLIMFVVIFSDFNLILFMYFKPLSN
jgi:hypothetical protein